MHQLYGTGQHTQEALATRYRVSTGPIKRAIAGVTLPALEHRAALQRGGLRLTATQVRAIRQRLARRDLHEVIATDFKVSVSAISNIATRRT